MSLFEGIFSKLFENKYQMDNLEKNHEQYFSRETIASSKSLLSKFNKVKKSYTEF